MHRTNVTLVLIAGSLGALSPTLLAEPKADEQVVAPADLQMRIAVSERGVHLAAVVRKGSKWTVVVDGAAGPRVDEVLNASSFWIDERPQMLHAAQSGSGRHALDQWPGSLPVLFTHDGSHFAYVVRQSQEWVLFEDHKEVLRLPQPDSSVGNDFRLQFSSAEGKHLLFSRNGPTGQELWVDAQKWPGAFTSAGSGVDSTSPLISPDGEHIAYPAQLDRDHRAVVIDGKVGGFYAEKLTYTSDSKHLIGEAPGPKGTALVVDGKPLFTAVGILTYVVAPVTNRIAAVLQHRYPDGSPGQFVLLDGKPVEPTLCKKGIQSILFSPDGKHCAVVCTNPPNIAYVVTDGKKGDEYDAVGIAGMVSANGGIAYSPDSNRLVYVAHGGGKYFLVVNGEESDDAYDNINGFLFSADGKRLAFCGFQSATAKNQLVIDGKTVTSERGLSLDQFDFSPDGSRFAYAIVGNYGGPMFVDGQSVPVTAMNFVFSPDSKHLAISGSRPTDNRLGLWLDGTMVYHGERSPDFIAFSADSKHLFWCAPEADPSRTNGNYSVLVTYADGKPVARADAFSNLSRILIKPVGYANNTIHPGWQAVGDSGLALLAPVVGGDITRYVITPTDTNLGTLLAAAQAAPSNH